VFVFGVGGSATLYRAANKSAFLSMVDFTLDDLLLLILDVVLLNSSS
jgi:hypothetical protein